MASGSRARGQGSAVAGADALVALDILINPDFAYLPAVDLVAHLQRDGRRGSDIADVALVLADRERRLTEAEDRIRKAKLNAAGLRDTIRELEEKVANAESLVRDRTVAGEDDDESQAGDHLTAIDVGAAELTGGEIRAWDLEIVVPEPGAAGGITPGAVCFEAGVEATPDEVGDNIPSPIPLMTIHAFAVPVTAAPALPDELIEDRAVEEVVADVAVPRSHKVAEEGVVDCRDTVSEAITRKMKKKPAASDLSLPSDDDLRRTSVPCEVVDSHLPYPYDNDLDVDNMPSPIPLMTIEASPVTAAPTLPDELIEERAVEQAVVDVTVPRSAKVAEAGMVDYCRDKVSEAISRKRKEPASDISLTLDNHRVTGHKVSKEETRGEDVAAASPHRRLRGEQPARATKKARKQTSFYSMVHKALMEKQNLLQKKEKEAVAKKAAAAACKQLHCRCWWSDAPCSP